MFDFKYFTEYFFSVDLRKIYIQLTLTQAGFFEDRIGGGGLFTPTSKIPLKPLKTPSEKIFSETY